VSTNDIRETFKHLRVYCDPRGHHVLDTIEEIMVLQEGSHVYASTVLQAVREQLEPETQISEARVRQIQEYHVPDPDTDEFINDVLGKDAA